MVKGGIGILLVLLFLGGCATAKPDNAAGAPASAVVCMPSGVDSVAAMAAPIVDQDVGEYRVDDGTTVSVLKLRSRLPTGDFIIVLDSSGNVLIYDPHPDEKYGDFWVDEAYFTDLSLRAKPEKPCQWKLRKSLVPGVST